MAPLQFAIPGDLRTLTGGYEYARRIIGEWRQAGREVEIISLPGGFPDPDDAELEQTACCLAKVPDGSTILVDGLAFGCLPRQVLERASHDWVALVHHPLALESGLDEVARKRLRQSERDALELARHVVVTSPSTARELEQEYGVGPDRITIALPGINASGRAEGGNVPPRLLSVATLTKRKGHDVLVAALAGLTALDWSCRIVGSAERDPATAASIRQQINTAGLGDRITLAGEMEPDALEAEYLGADIFLLASRHEGYGMAYAEAMAHGLPVIGCRAGAVPDTVPQAAGILTAPDDAEAFAAAIRTLLTEPKRRKQMADAAWEHGRSLGDWAGSARRIATVLDRETT
jgi:glycosyltransferase involved in cell wall biosynthesis